MHRGFENLTNLSLSRLQITKDKEELKRGRICLGVEVTRVGGRVELRGGEASWAASGFQPIGLGKIGIPFSFSIFYKFQTNLNFDDFYSHNKIQEHFTTQIKICIDMKCNKHNYLFI
jgi:hypothetical protein